MNDEHFTIQEWLDYFKAYKEGKINDPFSDFGDSDDNEGVPDVAEIADKVYRLIRELRDHSFWSDKQIEMELFRIYRNPYYWDK